MNEKKVERYRLANVVDAQLRGICDRLKAVVDASYREQKTKNTRTTGEQGDK